MTLLSHLYQAYKSQDLEYTQVLQKEYPEVFNDVVSLVIRANSKAEFDRLIEDLTK